MMQVARDAASLREIVARQCDQGVSAQALPPGRWRDPRVPVVGSQDVYMDAAAVEGGGRTPRRLPHRPRLGLWLASPFAARAGVHRPPRLLSTTRPSAPAGPGRRRLGLPRACTYLRPWSAATLSPTVWAPIASRRRYRRARRPGRGHAGPGRGGCRSSPAATSATSGPATAPTPLSCSAIVELVGMAPVAAIHTATRNLGPVIGWTSGRCGLAALADLLRSIWRSHHRHAVP